MVFLSATERETLAMICDALIPRIATSDDANPLATHDAHTNDVITRLEESYELVASESDRRELKLLLTAFNQRAFNGLMGHGWKPLAKMSLAEREALLQKWATSKLEVQRKAFQGIKRLALFLGYANSDDGTSLAYYEAINYPGVPGAEASTPKTIEPTPIRDNRTMSCDVLIIGSGAGGGVVAGELSAAGYDVLVVEKGGYHAEADFDGNELRATETLFENKGALTTEDTAMSVLAGTTLGGGTVVNWSASFRTPDHVLREWANTYGIADAATDVWQQSLDAVLARSNVSCDESFVNPNNGKFANGAVALGYHLDTIPRNVKGCEECGFCNYGCRFGAKQSTLKTYLQDAYARGTRIVVQANVRRVMHERGRVRGAVMEVTDDAGAVHLITVRAQVVVVSAGTIHTPAILKRSGLENHNIGENLFLHPTTPIFSEFDETIQTWRGVPMSKVSKEFANLDGRGYGVTLEVAPAHPGLTASTLPWINGRSHKALMGKMDHLANVIAITRDAYGGRIKLNRYGEPILAYKLHPYDAKHLMRGILEGLKIHYAAGANTLYSPHSALISHTRTANDSDFVRFLRRVEDAGLKPNSFSLFSAHQMSTARMAASPHQGAIKPNGESWEVAGLFVADGSAMPTATGVNPMMSIMGTAHYIAQHIKAALP